jgi:tetratricopeptide (TPR) repeat protein
VKSFLIGLLGVLCSLTAVWGDAANDLYIKGTTELGNGDYTNATKDFDEIIKDYPTTAALPDIMLRDGFAYLHLSQYDKAVEVLAPDTLKTAKDEQRATALYYTAIAQLTKGGKAKEKNDPTANDALDKAAGTFSDLIDYITTTPNEFNKDYLEDALYNRALTYFQRDSLDNTEKDLLRLTSKEFGTSLRRPDYFLLLGNLYFTETVKAGNALKPTEPADPVRALAAKSIAAFDTVVADPNARVQANEANMHKAEVLYYLAPLDLPDTKGYQMALDAFRLVHRKDDMLEIQQTRVDQLKAAQTARIRANPGAFLSGDNLLIDREVGRLDTLKTDPDPIIQALMRIADCYNAMKQGDEARTVLHRLVGQYAQLSPDQQKDVDFQILYSYVLGGQIAKADKALTDYLTKHKDDPIADSISYQMAADLIKRKDFAGALAQAQRSLNDFKTGRYVAQAVLLEADAYTGLGKTDLSQKVMDDYVTQNPKSPVVIQMLLTKAQNETAEGKFDLALADYKTVKDGQASDDLKAPAAAGYIQALQGLKRTDEIITEAQAFIAKYPNHAAVPSVLIMQGMAMDTKHDPGAVAVLQDVAKKFPDDKASPFALFFIVNIYQREGPAAVDKMLAAANDLATAYPKEYAYLAQAADAVSTVYLKQKKFTEALSLYQKLLDAPKASVAADASDKIGAIYLAAAKAMGSFQSQPEANRPESQKRLANAEQSYLTTLKKYPQEINAVGDAFQGLIDVMVLRGKWGLLTEAGFEDYLGKLTADLTTPDMQTRVELAKAGLVFTVKDGAKQFATALDRFKKAVAANAALQLTRQETNQFGELLLANKEYPQALDIYQKLLASSMPADQASLADAFYGLGATYLAQGDMANAKIYFTRMMKLNGEAAWHPHILNAHFGLALAAEQSGDDATAKPIFGDIMKAQGAPIALQARAMLEYGHILQRAGAVTKPANPADTEYAIFYYESIDNLYGPAVPALSAEGLFTAGQAYAKAGDSVNAKAEYKKIVDGYPNLPDWLAKAQAELAKP